MIFQIIYLFENTLSQKSANTEIKVKNEHQTIQASLSKRETCTSQGVELHENQELHKKQELSLILIPKMSQGRFEPPEVLTHTHTHKYGDLRFSRQIAPFFFPNNLPLQWPSCSQGILSHILSEDQGLVGSTKSCQS